MRLYAVGLLLAMLLLAPLALGAEQGAYKVVKNTDSFVLNADASFSDTGTLAMQVLSEQGIAALNQAELNYSTSLQDLTILEAYTLKPDGRHVAVPAANIQDRDVIAGGGPMYSDFKGKVIIFPNVEVGDTVVYTARYTQKVPMFPGQFSFMESFPGSVVVDDREISVSAPLAGPTLQTFAAGIDGGRQPDADGRAHWSWHWKNAVVADADDVVPPDERPRLLISSFKDFGALAQSYEDRAHAMAAVTPEIQAQADTITAGLTAPADQARALYTWVARNIRYAGNCIGVGSVVPHAAGLVLDNRLGDCKDHTALLQALLAAKGIESSPVLINSGNRYKLPELPVPSYFNHVINYIPSLDLYADSTSDFIPFGSLPFGEAGKVALHTEHFKGVEHTPVAAWKDYEAHLNVQVKIHADGSADGVVQNTAAPLSAMGPRQYFAGRDAADESDVVHHVFADKGFQAEGAVQHEDPHAGTNPYRFGITFALKNMLDLPGAGAFPVTSVYNGPMPLSIWAQFAAGKPVEHSFGCNGSFSVEDFQYELPAGMKILWLPRDVHVSAPNANYDATYKQVEQVITVHRALQYRIDTHLCTPEEGEAMRPLAQAVAKDLRAQVLYQMD